MWTTKGASRTKRHLKLTLTPSLVQIQGLKILCQGFLSFSFRMRAACIGGLAAMEELQLRYGRRFAPAIADEFKRSYLIFRASLNALADHALSVRVVRYHMRPKLRTIQGTLQCSLHRGAIQGTFMYTTMRTWWDWSKRSVKSATPSMFPGWPCRDTFCMYVCCGPVRMQCCDRRLAKRTIEHRSLHKMFACAWDRVLNVFLATSIFLGGFANPPAVWLKCRVWQVQYIYIRFQSRDQIELCQEHGAWFGNIIGKIGSVWISNIQHSSWFVGSLHRLCTFFGTHSHVHCKFWTSLVKIGSSNAFGYPTFELVCWFFTSFMYISWHA